MGDNNAPVAEVEEAPVLMVSSVVAAGVVATEVVATELRGTKLE